MDILLFLLLIVFLGISIWLSSGIGIGTFNGLMTHYFLTEQPDYDTECPDLKFLKNIFDSVTVSVNWRYSEVAVDNHEWELLLTDPGYGEVGTLVARVTWSSECLKRSAELFDECFRVEILHQYVHMPKIHIILLAREGKWNHFSTPRWERQGDCFDVEGIRSDGAEVLMFMNAVRQRVEQGEWAKRRNSS